jgi:uncharacterized protein (DUF433 family)
MTTFNDITSLAEHYGAKSLADLGKAFYDETTFGVSTTFLAHCHPTNKEYHYEDDAHAMTRALPNVWAGHFCTGIRFSTIVEGFDAEFTASDLIFYYLDEISLEDIQEAYEYLNERVEETLNPA